jgi:Fe-S-cluster containining protein
MTDCQSCGLCCRAKVADLCAPEVSTLDHCSKLRGTIGKDVSCSIYSERPQACRDFEAGSLPCRVMRLELLGER